MCLHIIWKHLVFLLSFTLILPQLAFGLSFALNKKDDDVVGELQYYIVKKGENFSKIGRKFNVGIHEMAEANPNINPWRPKAGTQVIIPTRFILPPHPRKGIVINQAELRLYYFTADGEKVYTYPVGIGRIGWRTPQLETKIIEKKKDPSWYVPESIKIATFQKRGIWLPDVVKPGPKNPLGKFALRLGERSYLIHGTNSQWSVGRRVSSGCIRLYAADIKELFHLTSVGTPTRIINEPIKIGKQGKFLYLESHLPLSDDNEALETDPKSPLQMIVEVANSAEYTVDWTEVQKARNKQSGVPELIGRVEERFFGIF